MAKIAWVPGAHRTAESEGLDDSLVPVAAAHPSAAKSLAAKYAGQAPRYTSYPTAPHFHAGVGEYDYRAWLAAIDTDHPVSLYLHVPFCQQLCWYCGCNTRVIHAAAPVAAYAEALTNEIRLVAEAIRGRPTVETVHFGGGTPNILTPADLDRIFRALRQRFAFVRDAEIAVEIDPRGLTRAWTEAAARNGLNRASLGVQDLNPTVQAAINRRQPWADTAGAVSHLRDAGVSSINLDLMYGLPHQTVATIGDTIDQILTVEPDRVALFGYAHVPWTKPAQKLISTDALPGGSERFDQQAAAAERLEQAGFVRIGLDHFARENDPLARAAGAGTVRRNFQGYTTDSAETLLGFGASSISRLEAGYVQNLTQVAEWCGALLQERLPVARGIALTNDDKLRGAIIERLMCGLEVDLEDQAGMFAVELDRLEPFVADGLLVRKGGRLTISEPGRPFVRAICAVFDRYFDANTGRHSRGV